MGEEELADVDEHDLSDDLDDGTTDSRENLLDFDDFNPDDVEDK